MRRLIRRPIHDVRRRSEYGASGPLCPTHQSFSEYGVWQEQASRPTRYLVMSVEIGLGWAASQAEI